MSQDHINDDCNVGNPDHVIASCTAVLERGSKESTERRAIALFNRGSAYLSRHDYDRSITDLDEAIRLKPDYAEAFLQRGNAYYGKEEYDRSITDLDEAIRLKPDYAEAFVSRAKNFFAKGDYDRGNADITRAKELRSHGDVRH